jgi:RND family efflux transporter MFP subunit
MVRLAALALVLTVSACTSATTDTSGGSATRTGNWGGRPQEQKALSVRAHRVVRQPISTYVVSNTALEAIREVTVFSRLNALVSELAVEEGDSVREGALLARLDDREVRNELAQAEIAVSQSQVALEQARVKAQLSKASFERAQSLFDQRLTSREEFDQASLVNRTDSLALENAQRQLEAARARLEAARIQLDYTTVVSPISGVVTQRLVNVGSRVNPGEALFQVQEFPPLWARIHVPERVLPQLRLGQPARLKVDTYPDREFSGIIKMISPTVDANTGTVKVTLELRNPGNLRPGMFGTAYIATQTNPNAVVVPRRSILRERDQSYVFVVNPDSTVSRREVTTGFAEEDVVEIVRGVEAGETIVTVGVETLNDGYPVVVQGGGGESAPVAASAPVSRETVVAPPTSPPPAEAATRPRLEDSPGGQWGPPGGAQSGQGRGPMFERMMQNPEIRKRWEARLKEDPSLATDPEKRRAFFREIMAEFGRPQQQP